MDWNEEVIEKIKSGKVGVMPTDTVYGVVCSALALESVERIYEVKKRDGGKPCVFLIGDLSGLEDIGVSVSENFQEIADKYWPGPVSLILDCDKNLNYLHRGKCDIAVRLPDDESLRNFLKQTGPLATSSANLEGQPPATTIEEAQKYFGDKVDFYVDGGELKSFASKIIKIEKGKEVVVRS
jgi:L-threonylcarbamoyladenylate synthase